MYSASYEFSETFDQDNSPDYVYYNGNIVNSNSSSYVDRPDPVVRFSESRDVPIVPDASKYVFSIVRFTMNGPNKDLPLFIPLIRTGASNPSQNVNLTIYSVTLKASVSYRINGNVFTNTFTSAATPVTYSPETLDTRIAPVPSAGTTVTGQDVSTRYYWVYTYSYWLSLCNAALQTAWADINAQFQAWYVSVGAVGAVPDLITKPPTLTRNNNNNLFSIWGDRYGFGGSDRTSAGSDADESFTLYFNNNMYGLFSNFDNLYRNLPNEQTNEILFYSKQYQNIVNVASPPAPAAKSYWVMEQDYESTSTLWCPVENITFTSTLLPIVAEQTGKPNVFGEGNDNPLNSSQFAFQPIVTDVALTNTSANDYREFIQYAPTAEYRLAAFQRSKNPISNIDIQVFWKNRLDGKLYPLTMFNNSSISIKIMLRRRGAENYPHPVLMGKRM
jgi:hypothetical protein